MQRLHLALLFVILPILAHAQGAVPLSGPISGPDQIVNAADFGLISDPTCATDATSSLRASIAAAARKKLILPAGTFCLNTPTSTLQITNSMEIEGQGAANTIIVWNSPAGTPYAPTIDVLAKGVTIHDLGVDGNAAGKNYTDSVYYGGLTTSLMAPWGEVAFVIEGDNFTGYNLKGRNAFTNCIGIGKVSSDGLSPVFGSPSNVNLDNIYTEFCGNGLAGANQPIPGHNGFGIDNGSGSFVNISNVIDNQSFSNFGNDLNAGGSVNWTNAWGYFARKDPSQTGQPASGFGFYSGSGAGTFSNINIISPASFGIWADAGSSQSSWSNITIRGAGQQCLIIGATSSKWNNVECQSPSQAAAGAYAAVRIRNDEQSCDANGQNCQPLPISNLMIDNLVIEGQTNTEVAQGGPPSWSYAIETTGGPNNVTGLINMNAALGTNGPTAFKLDAVVTGLQINHKEAMTRAFDDASIGPLSPYRFAFGGLTNIKSLTPNQSWQSSPFGDFSNNGSLFISDTTTPLKRIALGWDPINNIGVTQSINAGVLPMPFAINPSGGNVYLGQQSLSTTSFSGFPYMGSTDGNLTGTPTSVAAMVPFAFDATNKNFNIYSGSWLKIPAVTATAADIWAGTPNRLVQPSSLIAQDAPVALTGASHISLNMAAGRNYSLTLTLPVTNLDNPLNVVPGRTGFIRLSQDATGGRSITFSSSFKFQGGTPCAIATAANAVTYVRWIAFSAAELNTSCDIAVR
ncbi:MULTISPECIES: hypothetical protein [unclassified Rhizobium]|uniref:hypothetical protein n=1 Tax=unclassified Rhizobium TaxID=2613769 RepID=UPI001620BE70|nr:MULTISPECIES: hypothetical protein [unclassified Rhizobium]MBB3387004.1 hypothetical protein [Rhizobium sp. BK098]MBB3618673.1 hypothetical protein [Rhizobium sp. BK609]MBB3684365.1 hypothetical protein [Rhizobium sp. BK612]